jgi:hypothetical protein
MEKSSTKNSSDSVQLCKMPTFADARKILLIGLNDYKDYLLCNNLPLSDDSSDDSDNDEFD